MSSPRQSQQSGSGLPYVHLHNIDNNSNMDESSSKPQSLQSHGTNDVLASDTDRKKMSSHETRDEMNSSITDSFQNFHYSQGLPTNYLHTTQPRTRATTNTTNCRSDCTQIKTPMNASNASSIQTPINTYNSSFIQLQTSSWTRSRQTITQGKPLPASVVILINFLLGISPHSTNRTISGKIFYGFTLIVALGYICASLVYIHKDIESNFTRTTVVDGAVGGAFEVLWCALGIYANGLAYRLYHNEHFKSLLRIPSKHIFGVNAALVLFLLLFLAVAVNDYAGMWLLSTKICTDIGWVYPVACRLRYVLRVLFSLLALLWHYLVAFVLISASRCFTISIRQLMHALDRDGRVYEKCYIGSRRTEGDKDEEDLLLQEYTWIDQDFCEQLQQQQQEQHHEDLQEYQRQQLQLEGNDQLVAPTQTTSRSNLINMKPTSPVHLPPASHEPQTPQIPQTPQSATPSSSTLPQPTSQSGQTPSQLNSVDSSIQTQSTVDLAEGPPSSSSVLTRRRCNSASPTSRSNSCEKGYRSDGNNCNNGDYSRSNNCNKFTNWNKCNSCNQFKRDKKCCDFSSCQDGAHLRAGAQLMSNDEILYQIWKIQSGLRIFGLATQRWMLSLVSLIVIWLAINLVIWLNSSPNLIDLINLFLPLLLLPLLGATYAEVNFEGARLIKFIAPTEERLGLLYFLQSSPPLQLSIYGFTLSYATLATAAFGILIAIASKVFLQEMSGNETIIVGEQVATSS